MDDITVEKAMKITGLSQPTIAKWAKLKKQKRYGRGPYRLNLEFINFLKNNVKPRKRK